MPEGWEAYLGPVAVAQFIDLGWIQQWPMTLTAAAINAVQRTKYGVWNGTEQKRPPDEPQAADPVPEPKPLAPSEAQT